MANTKLSAFLSLLLVFCSGMVVGIVGYRVYNTRVSPPVRAQEKRSPEEVRNHLVDEMTKEVHLDDQQVTLLKQIYDTTFANFGEVRTREDTELANIHEQQVDRIKKMLRPDQIPLYDALRARREAEHRKSGGRRKGGPEEKSVK
jgi:hypothetical protein